MQSRLISDLRIWWRFCRNVLSKMMQVTELTTPIAGAIIVNEISLIFALRRCDVLFSGIIFHHMVSLNFFLYEIMSNQTDSLS